MSAYRDQTVEIALGPKGAFENGNIGTLKRRVPAAQVVSAVPESQRRPRRARPPREARTPRVAELLRKAIAWRAQLDAGEASNQTEIAGREGLTRARVTQVAPDIREQILSLPDVIGRPSITERALRSIARLDDVREQVDAFQKSIG